MKRVLKENSSLLFTIGAGAGLVGTAYLAAVAGYRSAKALEDADPTLDIKERARIVWRLYIPTVGAGAATVVCLASVKRIDARKTLAAQTALAVSQRAYEGYRTKVIEEFGVKKDEVLRAKVAEDELRRNPPPAIVAGSGDVLCCERFTGRYFMSSMQTLDRAVNDLNSKLLKSDIATLDDFYWIIGLELTQTSGQSGWETPKLLELQYSTILHEEKPCLAFEYNYVKSF